MRKKNKRCWLALVTEAVSRGELCLLWVCPELYSKTGFSLAAGDCNWEFHPKVWHSPSQVHEVSSKLGWVFLACKQKAAFHSYV